MLKIQYFILLITCITVTVATAAALTVSDLVCEYKTNPIGIDIEQPRLSWKIESPARNVMQTAFEIRTAATEKELLRGKKILWQDKVETDQSIHIPYKGPALKSGQRVYWQVRVWDNHNKKSKWSSPAFWEMGLLKTSDWKADWITPEFEFTDTPCPVLRKSFALDKKPVTARAYISALGMYEAELNGQKIGNQELTPGWTAYDERIQYQTFDITDQLSVGENVVGAMLGKGWFRGYLAWEGNGNIYGETSALVLQLHLTFADGSEKWIVTDKSWKAAHSPILMSEIYNGETYDARKEMPEWSQAGFDDSDWKGVKKVDHSKKILMASEGTPIVKVEELEPINYIETPAGERVIDFGQNMVGWVHFQVSGESGDRVVLRHAEVLDKDGNFYTENLRAAKQRIEYILKGNGVETFEPTFTFQGFRYICVDEWPGEIDLANFTGVVIHSEMPETGSFVCSNELINQLQHNIQWGQKGNFVDVPTDCPQRDERLGWTGDAQAFAPTACFNHDVAAFYTKWLEDLEADQKDNGSVPHVIPDVLTYRKEQGGGSAGWADAATIVPLTVYDYYGDERILAEQYKSMKAWVDYMAMKAGDSYFWNTDFTFGDWLAFNTNRSDYPGATTDKDLITQAFFALSTSNLIKAAKVLDKTEDVKTYSDLLENIKKVFNDEFVTPNGRLGSNTQTAYTLALAFDLLPKEKCAAAAERLAADVRSFKHITTGFLGTPLICHVLSDWGYWDEAFMLLTRTDYPSWLYPVTQGATTIWERWDGQKPDGSFQNKGMNSFNHYAYGAIGDWLYKKVAGLNQQENSAGFKAISIDPTPGGGLNHAAATYQSIYGTIHSGWKIEDGQTAVTVKIPANTTAEIHLDAGKNKITESGKPLDRVKGIQDVKETETGMIISAGSGDYTFQF